MEFQKIVSHLKEKEYLLIKEEKDHPFWDVLTGARFDYKAPVGIGSEICNVYPVKYQEGEDETKLARIRTDATNVLFAFWTKEGKNAHNEKSPFGCKEFQAYLEEIEWFKTKYFIMRIG